MTEEESRKEYGIIPSDSSGFSGKGLHLPDLPNMKDLKRVSSYFPDYLPEEPASKVVIEADDFRRFKQSGNVQCVCNVL